MYTETITYFQDETKCLGFVAYDNQVDIKRPAILIAPAWRGQDDFAKQKAYELAELGFVGFAVDIYGGGRCVPVEEALKYMMPLFADRKLLQGRMGAAYHCVSKLSAVDPDKIGAIGFCFGGLAVYELLRSGLDVKGVVSLHGVFRTERDGVKAKTVPIHPAAKGSILILNGGADPHSNPADIATVQEEFTKAGIDWQVHHFGQTMHGFTNPLANSPETGMMYNERSAKRSWVALQNFFGEIF